MSVIGYTNCGKTSLIKAITGCSTMQPRDQLFATLDVTCHGTILTDSNMETVLIDTVGFISGIPTPLIASFSFTLEDALQADLLLHVVDYSNPDWEHQVVATLRRLQVPVEDLEQWVDVKDRGALPISPTLGYWLDHLVGRLGDELISVTDRQRVVMKVRQGGRGVDLLTQEQ